MVSARRIDLKKKKERISLKKYNIRDCHVKLVRTNSKDGNEFLHELLRKNGVHGCSVLLHRLSPFLTGKKKKLLEESSQNLSVRFNVPWLPTVSTTVEDVPTGSVSVSRKSNEDGNVPSSSMLLLQKENATTEFRPAKRNQRSTSMFANRPMNDDSNVPVVTLDDFHKEFMAKRSNLKPPKERKFQFQPIQTIPFCKQIQNEIQEKIAKKTGGKI